MQNIVVRIIYASLRGGTLGLMGVAVAMLGRNPVRKECVLFSIGIGLFVLAELVFRKYRPIGWINNNITNPKSSRFLSRYPFLARVTIMVIGILVLAVCLRVVPGR